MKLVYFLIIWTYLPSMVYNRANLTAWEKHRRDKRYLIYQNGATVRFIAGFSFPVRLEDRVPYRQIRVLYNFQAQYDLPATASSLRPIWLGRTLDEIKYTYEKMKLYENDRFRTVLYTILEVNLNQNGRNGRECLKRAICENGQFATNEGLFAEIIHEVLRPSKHNTDKEYLDAYTAGKSGTDCFSSFPDCKKGDSFLDKIIFIKEF